jgi:hypothetical protein
MAHEAPHSHKAKLPNALLRRALHWRAGRIGDPLARLRFLRRTVGDRRVWDPRTDAGRDFYRRRRLPLSLAALLILLLPAGELSSAVKLFRRSNAVLAASTPASHPADVFTAESTGEYETYSNGLRIERKFETDNEPRSYEVFPIGREDEPPARLGDKPIGIVFHTTESLMEEFRAENSERLLEISEITLRYIRSKHAYNYVVDRFGRVWRVVRENQVAYHAGHSLWADNANVWVNLNRSFLGISVETQTQPGTGKAIANPAQVHAVRILTEMLRARYSIPEYNCVTHAQVSVNPSNRQVAYHYDWGANFPYRQVGLPDNYSIPSPAIALFAFTYDPSLVNLTGESLWKGLLLGEDQLRQNASAHGVTVAALGDILHKRYRAALAVAKGKNASAAEKAD